MSDTEPQPHTRTCRYGHGPLLDTPAGYFLPFVGRDAKERVFVPDLGSGYIVRVAVCQTCGYIELFDDDDGIQL